MITSDILKQQVLLEDIDEAELSKIAGITKQVSLKKGDQLFKEKDETKGLWLIHSGKIEISRITADGWRQTLFVLPAGHFFGELSILGNRKHVASATALEDTELLLIPKEDFDDLVQNDCSLALKLVIKLAIAMSKNLRRMNDKFLSALISY
ncbi:MAG TPA: cyclic nucleotide-binding domain-containing protein [Thermodesulfovibrionales bacterium]|jgi:CRP-like cAMP-binding protein|nr:cyclic nucleotide-binding domain-containing protein [Thermodesulfovibrionales bacterium]